MLKLHCFVFNPFQENTYILYDDTGECMVVDPGCFDASEKKELQEFISTNNLTVKLLVNTHCHIDHVLGNAFVKDIFGVDLLVPKGEEPGLKAVSVYAPNYGLFHYEEAKPDGYLYEGDVLSFGNQKLKIISAPGHSPDHMVFYHEESAILIGGDVLFYNSIGRTDLPGGNHDVLIRSIHHKLFVLPDDVKVYPGHGPETTIGFEKRTNPFCALTDAHS